MNNSFTKVILGILIMMSNFCFGQETNNWYFGLGQGLRLNFSTSPPTVTRGYPMTTEEGSSAISDVSGNALFYTDGTRVYDASTNAAFGPALLGGKSSTQSAIIVPKPGATNEWLLFTSNTDPNNGAANGINYYTVSGTPGAFTISGATNIAAGTDVGEGLCIVGSTKAGDTYWVVSRERSNAGSANIRSYAISNTGVVSGTAVVSSAGGTAFTGYIGTVKSNNCQTQIATTLYNGSRTELYNFDAATGQVTSLVASLNYAHPYGVEFSPNDDYLYFSQLDEGKLHQYDIANASDYSPTTTPNWDRTGELGQLQVGPDGKIYAAVPGGGSSAEYIGIISSPNAATSGANFSFTALQVNTVPATDGYCYRGLPTFPKALIVTNPIVGPNSGNYCVSTSIPLSFTFAGAINTSTIVWSYTGGGGTFSPSNTVASPSITFSTTGAKTVTVTFNDECGRTYTKTVNYNILNPTSTTGSISCGANCLTLTSPGTNPIWYDAATGGNIIAVGSPATFCYAGNAYTPSTLWVEEGVSASSTGNTNRTIGPTTLPGAAEGSPYGPIPFTAVADVVTLKSFVVKTYNSTGNFDVEIRNSSNTVVFLKTYNITTANADFTVNINADFVAGNYSIRFINTTHQWYRNAWAGATNAGEFILPSSLGATGQYCLANFIYDYKDFTVSTTCATRTAVNKTCSLPVEYLLFSGTATNSGVQLDWVTATEINNDYFDIQRSYDGKIFQSIGTVKGAGNSTDLRNYTFTDHNVAGGHAYYRLVQHDYDGTQAPSEVVHVALTNSVIAQIAPNPSREDFEIRLLNGESSLTYSVMDVTGKEVSAGTVHAASTRFGAELSTGTYVVKVVSGASVYHTSIIKY